MFLDPSFLANHVGWLLLLAFLVVFYKYATKNLDYWKKRNVPGPTPIPLIGNLWEAVSIKSNMALLMKKFHNYVDSPYIGIFTFGQPALVLRDRELIKTVLLKDFANFKDRVVHTPKFNETFNNILFVQRNPEWKHTRTKVTPVFTSAKLKNLFNIINKVGEEMVEYIKTTEKKDTKHVGTRFSTEVVTRTFFGIKGDCFEKERSEVLRIVEAMFGFNFRNAFIQSAYFFRSKLVDIFQLQFFEDRVYSFFNKTFWNCIKLVQDNKINSNTYIGYLADLEKKDPEFSKYFQKIQIL